MKNIDKEILKAYTIFTMHTNYRVENLTLKGHKIGTNIFLLHFINSNENCNMKSIVELLNVIPSTATKKIDKLVRLGLVKRELREENRRNVFLVLTDEGEEVLNEFFNIRSINMQKILENLSEEEKISFLNVIEKIVSIKGEFTF